MNQPSEASTRTKSVTWPKVIFDIVKRHENHRGHGSEMRPFRTLCEESSTAQLRVEARFGFCCHHWAGSTRTFFLLPSNLRWLLLQNGKQEKAVYKYTYIMHPRETSFCASLKKGFFIIKCLMSLWSSKLRTVEHFVQKDNKNLFFNIGVDGGQSASVFY